jgi:hypothetical protein
MNEDGQKSKEAGERLKSSYSLRLVIMIIWNDVDGFHSSLGQKQHTP